METIVRITILYWFLLLVIRVAPRRIGSITTPFEYLLVFLLGGLALGVVVNDDHSLVNALLGVSTLALNHIGVSMWKQRSQRFGRLFDGTPVVVFAGGEWQKKKMRDLLIQPQDVLTSARSQGVDDEGKIRTAIFERNGGFSVLKKDEDGEAQK